MDKHGRKSLWTLFLGVFTVSAFTFGGGFVIVTLLKKKFVDGLHWIDEKEMLIILLWLSPRPVPSR